MSSIRAALKVPNMAKTLQRGFSDSSKPNGSKKSPQPTNTKSMASETLRPLAIFGVGLYLGLSFFKGESKHKREESGFLKDLRDDFERTSGVSPPK